MILFTPVKSQAHMVHLTGVNLFLKICDIAQHMSHNMCHINDWNQLKTRFFLPSNRSTR